MNNTHYHRQSKYINTSTSISKQQCIYIFECKALTQRDKSVYPSVSPPNAFICNMPPALYPIF